MSGGIYWIASYPRSGNTWVRAFLTALGRLGSNDLLRGELVAPWIHDEYEQPLPGVPLIETIRNNEQVQLRLVRLSSAVVFRKTHAERFMAEGTATISPQATAGAVYLIRDPRDVAVSFAAFLRVGIDEAIARMNNPGFGYGEPVGTWSENVFSWSGAKDTLHLRYEDLLADPVEGFGRIVAHAGLNATTAEIAAAVAAASIDKMKVRDAVDPIHERKATVRSGVVGRWREELSPEQVGAIERHNRELMRRYGYL